VPRLNSVGTRVRSPSNITVITRDLAHILLVSNLEIHAYFTDFA